MINIILVFYDKVIVRFKYSFANKSVAAIFNGFYTQR